jgi:hypothetical protein
MSDLFVFPDVEALVKARLDSELPSYWFEDVTVDTVIPNPRPDVLIVVRRTGGPRLNLVADGAQLTVEAWHPADSDAQTLAQICRALIEAMQGQRLDDTTVYTVTELAGPQNLPDPLSEHPRYTFSVQIAVRGATLAAGS